MAQILKLLGYARRGLFTVLYWVMVAFTTCMLMLISYHMTINTMFNPLEWRLWAVTFFVLCMTTVWIYFRFYRPERLVVVIIRVVHWIMVALLMVAVVFAIFFAAVIATTGLEELNQSATETLLSAEFWQSTWLNAAWRQDVLWNESSWGTLLTQALFDVSWWQEKVFPWVIREVELHAELLDRLTGFSILAAFVYPILGSLLALAGSARILLGILFKAAGAGIFQRIALQIASNMRARHNHIPDKDIGVPAKIDVFESFRYEGMERGRLGRQLLQAYSKIMEQVETLPTDGTQGRAREHVERFLRLPFKELREALQGRADVVHALDDCLTGFREETRAVQKQVDVLENRLANEGLSFMEKRPVKKELKGLKKQMADIRAKYDGKRVWVNAISRKKGTFVPGLFQKVYPDYVAHEKHQVVPAIARAWGLLGDIETDMYMNFGIEVDTLDQMQRNGLVGHVKDLVALATQGRKAKDEELALLRQLVKNTMPSKLPVKDGKAVSR